MLRFRGSRVKKSLEKVKTLDAFPKISDTYTETRSARGGLISVITFGLIAFLVVSEVAYFWDTRLEYRYEVDVEFTQKVWLNFDITVATPCSLIGADVLDVTGDAKVFDQGVNEEVATFKLSPEDDTKRLTLVALRDTFTSTGNTRKLSELAIKNGFNATKLMVERSRKHLQGDADACRFFGNLPLNKVAGNFHIIAGKPINLFGGHAHLSMVLPNTVYNFSHRIDHLSFGDMRTGLINALDGSERVTMHQNHIYQYYLDIVSTKVDARRVKAHTYQFSVSEQSRAVDHGAGSHGMPGIYFKYDFSPVSVAITEKALPAGHFFTRICGIIGGIFASSCIVNGLAGFLQQVLKSGRVESKKRETNGAAQTAALDSIALSDTKPLYNVQLVSS